MSFHASSPLVIGTRGSPLALLQAEEVRDGLLRAGLPPEAIRIEVIRTSGDRIQDRALAEAGGKGLFTKEIDEAQLAGSVHVAVHSAKDLPTVLPQGLAIAGYLPREDARDGFLSLRAASLAELPVGAVIGTASLRRQAMLRRLRPDLAITLLRGNVGTRLDRMRSGAIDATILAVSGLKRMGLMHEVTAMLPIESFVPAAGQGAIAMAVRADDAVTQAALQPVLHRETGLALAAERAFLAVLDGSCRTPIGAYAALSGGEIDLHALVLRPDGSDAYEMRERASIADAERLGCETGLAIKARLPADFFVA